MWIKRNGSLLEVICPPYHSRSPCGLRRQSAATQLLGSRVRIPSEGNNVRLLYLLCVVWVSTRECVCLVVCDLETLTTRRPSRKLDFCVTESNLWFSGYCGETSFNIGFNIREGGPGSSVGIATELRAGRSGDRIPVWGEIFRTCPDRPWGPPSLLYNVYRLFPRE